MRWSPFVRPTRTHAHSFRGHTPDERPNDGRRIAARPSASAADDAVADFVTSSVALTTVHR
jgi:hypothetical protein